MDHWYDQQGSSYALMCGSVMTTVKTLKVGLKVYGSGQEKNTKTKRKHPCEKALSWGFFLTTFKNKSQRSNTARNGNQQGNLMMKISFGHSFFLSHCIAATIKTRSTWI